MEKVNEMMKSQSVDENEQLTAFHSLPASTDLAKKYTLSHDEGLPLICL